MFVVLFDGQLIFEIGEKWRYLCTVYMLVLSPQREMEGVERGNFNRYVGKKRRKKMDGAPRKPNSHKNRVCIEQ